VRNISKIVSGNAAKDRLKVVFCCRANPAHLRPDIWITIRRHSLKKQN